MMWRFKNPQTNWRLWAWYTEVTDSGFWIKYRGPFMWWGIDNRIRARQRVLDGVR